jgi:hypothetical protein
MEKFLKRFERLENTTLNANFFPDADLKHSKRFAKLEINDKKFELTIEDKVAPQESVPKGKEYFFLCPYCGGQNSTNLDVCSFCKRQLKNQYIPDYSGKTDQLKKCHCGAVNLKERKNCWVCGRDFSLWGDEEVKESPENIITLNIDGKIYKSTDKNLPPGIVALMEKIRREGFSKELMDQWARDKNDELDLKRNEVQTQISILRWQVFWRAAGVILVVALVFLRAGCYHSYH